MSNILSDLIKSTDILPGYKSDHSIIELNIFINQFEKGKGTFKFNTKLLKDPEYLSLINYAIKEEKIRYSVPVDNFNDLEDDKNIQFTIPDDLFLETLLLRIRYETIKYSSDVKKKESKIENQLQKQLERLEECETEKKDEIFLSKKNSKIFVK